MIEATLQAVGEPVSGRTRQWENPSVGKRKCQSRILRERNLAEREGFEPPVGISYARFPGVCLKPLSHLSASKA